MQHPCVNQLYLKKSKLLWDQDEYLKTLIEEIKKGEVDARYSFVNKQLRKNGKLIVGVDSELREKIIQLIHTGPDGGHFGVEATHRKSSSLFCWKGLKKVIIKAVRNCDICLRNKSDNVLYPGLLQPLAIPGRIWEEISMDFIDGLPNSKGNTSIWVIVDRLSKFPHFIPLTHPSTAQKLAKIYIDRIYKLHGLPKVILSDRDAIFTNLFWKNLFKCSKVQLSFTTSYHPKFDGQT